MGLKSEAFEQAVRARAQAGEAAAKARFFRAGPGEYGEGDQFLGVRVPELRAVARHFEGILDAGDLPDSLDSPWHEVRLAGLLVMVGQYQRARGPGAEALRGELVDLYESRFERVNNWDLVDSSAPYLTGPWYLNRDRAPLFRWAASGHLWTQRIALMTTFAFIRAGDFSTTFELADRLKDHPHDLIHKAGGWMIREVANRDQAAAEAWLKPRYESLPRTWLRYAVEKFPRERYRAYLEGRV